MEKPKILIKTDGIKAKIYVNGKELEGVKAYKFTQNASGGQTLHLSIAGRHVMFETISLKEYIELHTSITQEQRIPMSEVMETVKPDALGEQQNTLQNVGSIPQRMENVVNQDKQTHSKFKEHIKNTKEWFEGFNWLDSTVILSLVALLISIASATLSISRLIQYLISH